MASNIKPQTTIQEYLAEIRSIIADVYAFEKENGIRDRDSLSLAIGDRLSAIESMLSQPMKGAEEWIKEIRSHGKVFCSQEEVDASVAEDIRAIQNDAIASVLKVSKSTGLEWLPIETFNLEDEMEVILFSFHWERPTIGYRQEGAFYYDDFEKEIHPDCWMPIPPLPRKKGIQP